MNCFSGVSFRAALMSVAGLVGAHAHAPVAQRVPAALPEEVRRYVQVESAAAELLSRYPKLFSEQQGLDIRGAIDQFRAAQVFWQNLPARSKAPEFSRVLCEMAAHRITRVLESLPQVERPYGPRRLSYVSPMRRLWVSGGGVFLLRIARDGPESDTVPDFVVASYDLRKGEPVLAMPASRIVYAILYFYNAPPGDSVLTVRTGPGNMMRFPVTVPATGRLSVNVTDESGPTPAVVGLYASDGQPICIDEAVLLYKSGPGDCYGRMRRYTQAHYWPGDLSERRVCFVDSHFEVALPEGEYTLMVAKGFEYTPVRRKLNIVASAAATDEKISLRRWIDMAAQGWISGDGHVHYDRMDAGSERRLFVWTRAEDIRIGNILQMGDVNRTYFPQYAFGKRGRKSHLGYWLVPGQEDPRTDEMGHAIQWNIVEPVRFPDRYLLYDLVFDEVRRQGGLTGYAHVYQAPRTGFWVRRDMSLNVPRGKIDFAEVAEFGDLDPELYFEFLNLGFRLAATAGSDVPWGESVGAARVYAFTGGESEPDAWFRAVRQGRTFVSTGSMLDFTVNGERPGSEVIVRPGETVKIRATARGENVLPRFIEIIEQGDIVRSTPTGHASQTEIALEFEFKPARNTWLVARSNDALTSPVYIRVGPGRFWKKQALPELVKLRMRDLAEIEAFTRQALASAATSGNKHAGDFAVQSHLLLDRVQRARTVYTALLNEARAEQ